MFIYNFYLSCQICGSHLDDHQDPGAHYKAVCRALITEAHELLMFLDVIVRDQKVGKQFICVNLLTLTNY